MGDIRQGDVYWVDFDEPVGSEPGYRRPCVIIQNDLFNKSRLSTVVVCAISSNLRVKDAPGNVSLKRGEANLPKNSVVNIAQIETIDKDFLIEKIGSLSSEKIKKILDGIHLLVKQIHFTADE